MLISSGPFRRGLGDANGRDGVDAAEELRLPPSRWHLTGFLAPPAGREKADEEANEELGVGNDDSEEETGGASPEPKRKCFMPASIGLTVFVPADVRTIDATVRYANYERVDEEPPRTERARKIWKRMPVPAVTERLDLTDGSLEGDGIAVREGRGLRLEGQVRPVKGVPGVSDGTRAVSVFLVNRRAAEAQGYRDAAYVFQGELELHCESGFFGRPNRTGQGAQDLDDQIGDLHYRDVLEYGVGHGVSVAVDEPAAAGPVTRVATTLTMYYDPRTAAARSFASLHARCLIVDHEHVLITSANFTGRAQERNIEVGVVLHDKGYAVALERQ